MAAELSAGNIMKSTYNPKTGILTVTISSRDQVALNQADPPIQTVEAEKGRAIKRALNHIKDLADYNGQPITEIRLEINP